MTDWPLPYDWERNGNTRWAACPSCGWTYPITSAMAEADHVSCVCPSCGTEFRPGEDLDAVSDDP